MQVRRPGRRVAIVRDPVADAVDRGPRPALHREDPVADLHRAGVDLVQVRDEAGVDVLDPMFCLTFYLTFG